MKIEQILSCSFERWYPIFKHLTIKSEIIEIPNEVVKYLRSNDSRILPKCCNEPSSSTVKSKDDFSDTESESEFTSEDESEPQNQEDFPEFDKEILKVLEKLDNKVFIKLNWSSPKDAYWCLNKLSCESLRDVYMLLCSSDFMSHDLNEPFDKCNQNTFEEKRIAFDEMKYYLIMRRWNNSISPSMEFRCFVKDNQLKGISQRDCRTYYKHIQTNRESIVRIVKEFYETKLHKKFTDSSFVFDIFIKKNNNVLLLDFNPYGEVTDSLLFDWEELDHTNEPLFKCIESKVSVGANEFLQYHVPRDFLEGLDTANDSEKIADLLKKQIDIQEKEDKI